MTLHLRLLLACFLAAGFAACGGGSNAVTPQSRAGMSAKAAATLAPTLLAVANATNNSITVFPIAANGNVAPLRTIAGPHTGLANPTDIAADTAGNLYVVNNGASSFSVTVYGAGVTGDVAPIRTISGAATGLQFPIYARVDANGILYVSNAGRGGPFSTITEYAAGANGNVAPIRALAFQDPTTGLHCFFPGPLALDAAGDLFVASNPGSAPGEVAMYAPGATDCTKPLHVLRGAPRLMSPSGLAFGAAGGLVVSDVGSPLGEVVEFSPGAKDSSTPLTTISGIATHLLRPAGVAVDSAGSIYVANTAGNSVTVFASTAVGNAVPIRTIAGALTGLNSPGGITLVTL